MADDKKRIAVVFEKNKNASSIPVTGAWGGPSPDGQSVVAHFYIEYGTTPNSIQLEVEENKPADINKGERISRGDLTREIQSTLVMSPHQAITIGQWLQTKGQQALQIQDKAKGNNND